LIAYLVNQILVHEGAEFLEWKSELFSVHWIGKIKVFGMMISRGVSISVCWNFQVVLE